MVWSIALVQGVVVATWSCGTSTGGRVSSSGVVCDRLKTAVGVIIVLFLEDASSDNMGNEEFSVGTSSFKEGTKFPIVEDGKRSFSFIPYE